MTPDRLAQLDRVFMEVAQNIASMSLATRSKVGAVLVKQGNIVSMGWNGLPSGFPNSEIELNDNDLITTNPLVLHAEANAILKCAKNGGTGSSGATLYVTMSPCKDCCKLIIQAGIERVVFRDLYRDASALEIFKRTSIKVEQLQSREKLLTREFWTTKRK